ncbi:hypothetical protein B0G80_5359 [Paraburkholderia sp. BL6669N2]|nr:hypothetical protein B0G80_5359 [Paraburkholderia sp. BL6669N2]
MHGSVREAKSCFLEYVFVTANGRCALVTTRSTGRSANVSEGSGAVLWQREKLSFEVTDRPTKSLCLVFLGGDSSWLE